MEKIFLNVSLAIGLFILNACNSDTGKIDSTDSAKDLNKVKMDSSSSANTQNESISKTQIPTTTVNKDDADFAVMAADGGMEEVQLGQLAQQNALNPRVKDFGSMMIKDHTDAGNKLKAIASSKNISLPATLSSKAQDDYNKLNNKKGKDFDKAYVNMMVDDHKNDIKDFQKEGEDGKDSDIKSLALHTLPMLQTHLDSIQAIKKAFSY